MQFHTKAAMLPLDHCHKPKFTSGGKFPQLFYFPLLLQVLTLGDPPVHQVREGGKLSKEEKLLQYGAPELLMLINDTCSVATTAAGLGEVCRNWLSGCLLRS